MSFPLQQIIFEVTRECNLSCRYCYNHWRRNSDPVHRFNFNQAKKTLRKVFKSFDCRHITFTGGEPFCADGLKEQILFCRMKGKGVTVITNGTKASAEEYRLLSDMGVGLFELPLHSYRPEIHDHLTGVPGSHQKVVDSLKILCRLKSEVCVAIVLTQVNASHIRRTLEYIKSLGIRRVMLARFNIGGRGMANCKELLPSLSQLRQSFDIANGFAGQHDMRISANVCVPLCVINPDQYPNIPISMCGSNLYKKPVTIDARGDLRICNHSPVTVGNIHTTPIVSLFETPYVREWRTARPEYCVDCDHWHLCRGGCKAASEQLDGSLYREDPIIGLLNVET